MSEEKKESIIDKKISRRSMLKWTAGLAVAGAAGIGIGASASDMILAPFQDTKAIVSVPAEEKRFIVSAMHGPRYVYVSNGRIVRSDVIPVPADAAYCRFKVGDKTFTPPLKSILGPCAMAYRDYTNAPNRVMYPMKRVGYVPGGKGPVDNRGKGEFVRISWDEALDTLAKEIKRMWEVYGAGAIANASK